MVDATASLNIGSGRSLHFTVAESLCPVGGIKYPKKSLLFCSFNQLKENVSKVSQRNKNLSTAS